MNNQGNQGNPQDDDTEAGTITMSIADYNKNMAAARRGGRERAERRDNPPPASSTAAPAGSGDMEQRFSRLEGMFSTLIERMTPPAAPTGTPPTDPLPAPRPAAAAPAPPSRHTLPTNMGFPDIWGMSPEQFVEWRDTTGQLRPTLEKMWEVGARMQGAPRPPLDRQPFTINSAGERVPNPRFRG